MECDYCQFPIPEEAENFICIICEVPFCTEECKEQHYFETEHEYDA